jgi:hypothetical protein
MRAYAGSLCIVGLAASHSIVKERKSVVAINYDVGGTDRSQNQVKGKRKKGGIWLEVNSLLCEIRCADGYEYRVRACVRGHLLEVNPRLQHDLSLLSSPDKVCCGCEQRMHRLMPDWCKLTRWRMQASTEGFICIIKPTFQEADTAGNHLQCISSR